MQRPASKRTRKNSTIKDYATDEEEDFDEGTPPPSDDSGDEVGSALWFLFCFLTYPLICTLMYSQSHFIHQLILFDHFVSRPANHFYLPSIPVILDRTRII